MNHATPAPAASSSPSVELRQLWPADVGRLRLEHHPRVDAAEAAALLVEAPGASFWIPDTAEFLLVTPWRRRQDLVTIHTFGAFSHERHLVERVAQQAASHGRAGLVLVDVNESRRPAFYARHRFERLEDLVTYTHRAPMQLAAAMRDPAVQFQLVELHTPELLDAVEALDHAAFPWFWWNSREEFLASLADPAVEVWAGLLGQDVVSYVAMTSYHRWGHLDRIATCPELEGRGIGRASLAFAAGRLTRLGARQVALSTQGRNERSRELYHRAGFERTPRDDYSVYVRVLDPERIHGQPGFRPRHPAT
jgi:GNAT superfamily N-acetyltransferase